MVDDGNSSALLTASEEVAARGDRRSAVADVGDGSVGSTAWRAEPKVPRARLAIPMEAMSFENIIGSCDERGFPL